MRADNYTHYAYKDNIQNIVKKYDICQYSKVAVVGSFLLSMTLLTQGFARLKIPGMIFLLFCVP